jgi:hypothetical protein
MRKGGDEEGDEEGEGGGRRDGGTREMRKEGGWKFYPPASNFRSFSKNL